MESPVGQFLSQILTTHPHLLPAAVEQQLEKLQTDRDAEQQEDKPSSSGTDLVLYRFAPSIVAQAKTILFDSKWLLWYVYSFLRQEDCRGTSEREK